MRWITPLLALGLLVAPTLADEEDDELERALKAAMHKVYSEHCEEVQDIVEWCLKKGLLDQADEQIAVIEDLLPEYEDLAELREERAEASAGEHDEEELAELLEDYAGKVEDANKKNGKELFDLAKKCMKAGLFTRAYDLVNAAMVADPDNKKARKILGWVYDRRADEWIREWEEEMRDDYVLYGDEGWVPEDDIEKWEEGLRPFAGEWVTIEEEREKRSQNDYRAWEVESEHFTVKTNLGRAEGWEFCQLLEDYYYEFFRVFIGFYDQKRGSKLAFQTAEAEKKHLVHLYPSRDRYLRYVKAEHGNDQLLVNSAGFYSSSIQSSHFYWGADVEDTLSTLYHEVTHQLFAETKPRGGGSEGNNWVVEGIASYCETWEKVDGRWYPGQKTRVDKMMMAKRYLEQGNFNLRSFVSLDHDGFHETPNRGLHYALACAFSHFLMHFDDELYKEDFVRVVSGYYAGHLENDSLQEYLEVDLPTLQNQFVDYMSNLEIR